MDIVEEKAIAIVSRAATEAHRGQTRKDGKTPFIVHPERVAKCVAHYGGNHVGVIAAWLHDVIEDNTEGAAIVRKALEETCLPENNLHEIYAIVLALTKNPAIPGKRERFADTLDGSSMPRTRQSLSRSVIGWITRLMPVIRQQFLSVPDICLMN